MDYNTLDPIAQRYPMQYNPPFWECPAETGFWPLDMRKEIVKSMASSLARTRNAVFNRIRELTGTSQLSDASWEELEELLIEADLGLETGLYLVNRVRQRVRVEGKEDAGAVRHVLAEEMRGLLAVPSGPNLGRSPLDVVLVVGVNGSGKTTSIAKLAKFYQRQGRRVLLGAADTYRAAAVEQLSSWASILGVDVVRGPERGDPGAVVFDTLQAAKARNADMAIIDTAGRLHTKFNLMAELGKIRKVAEKTVVGAPHETLLVLDATTGQNALAQARHFLEAVAVSGVILAKLDSTARGGMAFAIARELGLPVRFVGTGEAVEDLEPFDSEAFMEGLLG
jgi:fused signal recognition particle receptor